MEFFHFRRKIAWRQPSSIGYVTKKIKLEENFHIHITHEPKYYGNLFSERGKILFNHKDYDVALMAYLIVYAYDEKKIFSLQCILGVKESSRSKKKLGFVFFA